jgi:hypothetical protein
VEIPKGNEEALVSNTHFDYLSYISEAYTFVTTYKFNILNNGGLAFYQ